MTTYIEALRNIAIDGLQAEIGRLNSESAALDRVRALCDDAIVRQWITVADLRAAIEGTP